jgi:hypothetical protein
MVYAVPGLDLLSCVAAGVWRQGQNPVSKTLCVLNKKQDDE